MHKRPKQTSKFTFKATSELILIRHSAKYKKLFEEIENVKDLYIAESSESDSSSSSNRESARTKKSHLNRKSVYKIRTNEFWDGIAVELENSSNFIIAGETLALKYYSLKRKYFDEIEKIARTDRESKWLYFDIFDKTLNNKVDENIKEYVKNKIKQNEEQTVHRETSSVKEDLETKIERLEHKIDLLIKIIEHRENSKENTQNTWI